VEEGDHISVDTSLVNKGILLVKDDIDKKIRIQITYPDGTLYPYPMLSGEYKAFPLTGSNGTYQLTVFEEISDSNYAVAYNTSFEVTIGNEFDPYIYPNQYIDFDVSSDCVKLGFELSEGCADDLDYVEAVYKWVTKNVDYDDNLAANAPKNYIPDPDVTLNTGMGICFDYASLMSAMLRSQKVPTKLVVGYSGTAYHAWISVYLDEIGWVDNIIEFNGKEWTLIDPTLGANADKRSIEKYIGNGGNYIVKYQY